MVKRQNEEQICTTQMLCIALAPWRIWAYMHSSAVEPTPAAHDTGSDIDRLCIHAGKHHVSCLTVCLCLI